ncbi:MAG: hypothetical protein ACI4RD_07955 [Kiritimatiellia bacterium]
MKKVLLAMALAAGSLALAEEGKYVDPNPFGDYGPAMRSTAEHPLAVDWSRKHDAEIAAVTADEVLAAQVADAAAAAALLAKLKGAYASDPLVLTQIAAVTQWVMLPDPWYCLFWNGPHAAGRAVWTAALQQAIDGAADEYVRVFCRQQLDLCGR